MAGDYVEKKTVLVSVLKSELPAIQSSFEDLKNLILDTNPKLERKLNEIGDELDYVNPDMKKDKFNIPFKRFR